MTTIDIKSTKRCAFCKYWYDTTNQEIESKTPQHNIWAFNERAKKKCLKRNMDMRAMAFCDDYACKLPII